MAKNILRALASKLGRFYRPNGDYEEQLLDAVAAAGGWCRVCMADATSANRIFRLPALLQKHLASKTKT